MTDISSAVSSAYGVSAQGGQKVNPFGKQKGGSVTTTGMGARHVPHPHGQPVSSKSASVPNAKVPVSGKSKSGSAPSAGQMANTKSKGNGPLQTGSRAANSAAAKANGSTFGGY